MQMVKIKFHNPADDARGALELAQHFTVICLPEDTYEVPEAALTMLDELHFAYGLLETEGFDYAVRALRHPFAPSIQRRHSCRTGKIPGDTSRTGGAIWHSHDGCSASLRTMDIRWA